jgi:hypothetical protein
MMLSNNRFCQSIGDQKRYTIVAIVGVSELRLLKIATSSFFFSLSLSTTDHIIENENVLSHCILYNNIDYQS